MEIDFLEYHNGLDDVELCTGFTVCGAKLCLYDGAANYPDIGVQWRFAKEAQINHFGNGSPLFIATMKQNIKDVNQIELSKLKTIGATGSPLSEEDAFIWIQDKLPKTQIISLSGGTDVCSAFIGGCTMLPVYSGYLQCNMLGAAIEAFWDENKKPILNQTGELVITQPLPSMPVFSGMILILKNIIVLILKKIRGFGLMGIGSI